MLELSHIHARHPIAQRLPNPHRSDNIQDTDGVLLMTPHKGTRNPRRRAEHETKVAKCTSICGIAQKITANSQQINKLEEPPWHRVNERVTVRVPMPTAGKSLKKRWARRHKRQLRQLENRREELIIYSDGSLRYVRGIRFTGAGVVGFRGGTAQFQTQFTLGSTAEVYDAEMEGLAKAAEMVRTWFHEQGPEHGIRQIWFFADNTGALQRIYKGTPGYDQECSSCFRSAAHHILDPYPDLSINVKWVPGHHNISGNNIADKLAKKGSADEPSRPDFATAAFVLNTHRKRLREKWCEEWETDKNNRHHSDFRTANQTPPTINPSKHFCTLDRKTSSRVFQCRTGHAHIGSYYDYFEILEPRGCGAFQTRNHILLRCNLYAEHRHLLRDDKGNLDIQKILGTPKGILRLAEFISATGAFSKPNEY